MELYNNWKHIWINWLMGISRSILLSIILSLLSSCDIDKDMERAIKVESLELADKIIEAELEELKDKK